MIDRLQKRNVTDMLPNVAREERALPERADCHVELSLPRIDVHGVAETA